MSQFCAAHQIPRARIDPIDTPYVALGMLNAMLARPMESEIVAVLLDHEYRGLTVLSIGSTPHPDAVFDAADTIVECARQSDEFGAVVVASVRPGQTSTLDDVDRWMEISDQLELAGIELVEWFVIGRDVSCPRELLGEPPRWRC